MKSLLASILAFVALAGCNSSQEMNNSPPVELQETIEEKVQPTVSKAEMNIKCREVGEAEFQDMYFDDGYIAFKFYYSPSLDTCLVEREESGPGPIDVVFKIHDIFGANRSMPLARFSLASCSVDDDCVTLQEYNQQKEELLK